MLFRLSTPYRLTVRDQKKLMPLSLIRAAAKAVDEGSQGLLRDNRAAMTGQRLGRMGNALGAGSDLRKGRAYVRRGNGLSTSGWVYIRSKGDRTTGAIVAYTEGASIRPKGGRRWLAIPTDEIPSRVGKERMTPALYDASGLDRRIGELEFIPGKSANEAFLIARDVTVNAGRGYGGARRRPRNGNIRAGRAARGFIVAFILIRRTARTRRVDPLALAHRWHARIPRMIEKHLEPNRRATLPTLYSSSTSFRT